MLARLSGVLAPGSIASLLIVAAFCRVSPSLCAQVVSTGPSPSSGLTAPPVGLVDDATEFRWDNIEGRPVWVSGVRPRYSLRHGVHTVRLAAGGEVVLRVEPREVVRARPLGDAGGGFEELLAEYSNGGGLWRPLTGGAADADGSRLYFAGSLRRGLIRFALPASSAPAEVALYLLRSETTPLEPLFRDVVPFDGPPSYVWDRDSARREEWWRLDAGVAERVRVEGPCRLLVSTRFQYAAAETQRALGYRLSIVRGGVERSFELPTLPDAGARASVDGEERVVGRERIVHVEIPWDEYAIEVRSSSAALVRIVRYRPDDRLLPRAGTERPIPAVAFDLRVHRAWDDAPLDDPLLLLRALEPGPRALETVLAARERAAWPTTSSRRGVFDAAAFERFSRARDVLPLLKHQPDEVLAAQFVIVRLRARDGLPEPRVLEEQFIDAAAEQAASGRFLRPPVKRDRAYRYPLAYRGGRVRLAVARERGASEARFLVEFPGQELVTLRYDPTDDVTPRVREPALAETARALREVAAMNDPWETEDRIGHLDELPLLEASAVELDVPSGAAELRLWCEGEAVPPIAVEELVESRYEMAESEYLAARLEASEPHARDRAASSRGLFLESYRKWREGTAVSREPLERMLSEWDATFRLLASAEERCRERLREGRTGVELPGAAPSVRPGEADLPSRATIDRLAAGASWVELVETTSRRLRANDPDRSLWWLRLRGLEELGESFLVRRQLYGVVAGTASVQERKSALERLLERELARSELAAHDLAAHEVLRGNLGLVPELLRSFVRSGHPERALYLGLGFLDDERCVELVAQAALARGWWQTFETAIERLPSPAASFWKGLRFESEGRHDVAEALLLASGDRGRAFADAIREGEEIARDLLSPDLAERARAVLAWEDWQRRHPGERVWKNAGHLITDFAGVSRVARPELGFESVFYRATVTVPVKLRVEGPATLRFECRPLHDPRPDAPWSGSIRVRAEGEERRTVVLDNLPSQTAVLADSTDARPGDGVDVLVNVGPGLRELTIAPSHGETLVACEIERPELPLSVLPPWSPETVRSAIAPPNAEPDPSRERVPGGTLPAARARLAASHHGDVGAAVRSSSVIPRDDTFTFLAELGPLLAARLALRLDASPALQEHGEGLVAIARAHGSIPAAERLRARILLGSELDPYDAAWQNGLDAETIDAVLTARGRQDVIARRTLDGLDTAAAVRQLGALLDLAERQPHGRLDLLVRGARLFHAARDRGPLAALFAALQRGTRWSTLKNVRDSAGVRFVAERGWSPESPYLRARKALLARLTDEEHVVTGRRTLGVELDLPEEDAVDIALRLHVVEDVARHPVTVLLRLDDSADERIELTPASPEASRSVRVPHGRHVLRLRCEEPVSNHFVGARFSTPGADARATSGRARASLLPDVRRKYLVATAEHPLAVSVSGPAWVRVDERRDGVTLWTHHFFEGPGPHSLRLVPPEGREKSLFRLYTRVASPANAGEDEDEDGDGEEDGDVAARVEALPPLAEPRAPLVRAAGRDTLPTFVDEEVLPLGGHEDGTFALSFSAQSRRYFEEDDDPVQNFLQLGLDYRYRSDTLGSWFESAVLSRVNEFGGPTFGFESRFLYAPDHFPVALTFAGEGYLQWPEGDDLAFAGSPEFGGRISGRVSRSWSLGAKAYHRPAVTFFGRALSLDNNDDFDPAAVDSDVFSSYKRDHLSGVVLNETIAYRPWIDTEWSLHAALTSNENMNIFGEPDSAGVTVAWTQLAFGALLEGGYRYKYFFNDNDRLKSSFRDAIFLRASHDLWLSPRDRLEAGIDGRYDLSDSEVSGFVYLAWHFGGGRGYRDYVGVEFRSLRERAIPDTRARTIPGTDGER